MIKKDTDVLTYSNKLDFKETKENKNNILKASFNRTFTKIKYDLILYLLCFIFIFSLIIIFVTNLYLKSFLIITGILILIYLNYDKYRLYKGAKVVQTKLKDNKILWYSDYETFKMKINGLDKSLIHNYIISITNVIENLTYASNQTKEQYNSYYKHLKKASTKLKQLKERLNSLKPIINDLNIEKKKYLTLLNNAVACEDHNLEISIIKLNQYRNDYLNLGGDYTFHNIEKEYSDKNLEITEVKAEFNGKLKRITKEIVTKENNLKKQGSTNEDNTKIINKYHHLTKELNDIEAKITQLEQEDKQKQIKQELAVLHNIKSNLNSNDLEDIKLIDIEIKSNQAKLLNQANLDEQQYHQYLNIRDNINNQIKLSYVEEAKLVNDINNIDHKYLSNKSQVYSLKSEIDILRNKKQSIIDDLSQVDQYQIKVDNHYQNKLKPYHNLLTLIKKYNIEIKKMQSEVKMINEYKTKIPKLDQDIIRYQHEQEDVIDKIKYFENEVNKLNLLISKIENYYL